MDNDERMFYQPNVCLKTRLYNVLPSGRTYILTEKTRRFAVQTNVIKNVCLLRFFRVHMTLLSDVLKLLGVLRVFGRRLINTYVLQVKRLDPTKRDTRTVDGGEGYRLIYKSWNTQLTRDMDLFRLLSCR